MKVISICKYCNHQEIFWVYDENSLDNRKCEKCGDKSKKVKKVDSADVFGYESQEPKKDAYVIPEGSD